MANSPFLPTKDAAEFLGLSNKTLESMRVRGGGPPFYKFGRRVLYNQGELQTWAESRRRVSTSDPGTQVAPA